MKKETFIYEVNLSIKGINLTDDVIEYEYIDTSESDVFEANVVANVIPLTGKATITYKGKTKVYQTDHGTTFPCDFINDYKNGYYS